MHQPVAAVRQRGRGRRRSGPSAPQTAIGPGFGPDLEHLLDETVDARRDAVRRKLVLDIVDRIHEMRYWEKRQDERATPAPSKPLRTQDQVGHLAETQRQAPVPDHGTAPKTTPAAGARPLSLSPGSDGSGADPPAWRPCYAGGR